MGILDYLVSLSEEFAWQAWLQVVEQRRMLELLKRQADTEAVRQAQVMLATLERVYGVALYRLNGDREFRVDPSPAISATRSRRLTPATPSAIVDELPRRGGAWAGPITCDGGNRSGRASSRGFRPDCCWPETLQ